MTHTSPRISFGLYGLEIKPDSLPSTTSPLQPFSKIDDLRTDSATNRLYASYEPNFWLLDGEYKFLPVNTTTVHTGMVSLAMSNSAGVFAMPPVLTINFSLPHTSDGLALRFATYSGDYCSSVTIAFYNAAYSLIRSDTYAPTGPEFSTGQPVTDFKRIIITFNSTSRPYRYLRLTGVDYGELLSFEGADIKTATVVEEVDQLSAEVRYETMEFGLYSNNPSFNILNPAGYYAALAERQPVAVYETVGLTRIFIGNFYLDEWSNTSDTNYSFHAIDILGVLGSTPYRGGIWLGSGLYVEVMLKNLLEPLGVPYELDNQLVGIMVKGWIPRGTYREALQQIAFAVGASVSCSRSSAIKIFKSRIAQNEPANYAISHAEKGADGLLSLLPMITSVDILAHDYLAGSESQVVMSGSYAAGVYEVNFADPMHTLSASGARIIESGVNYAILEVTGRSPAAVAVTGLKYIDTVSNYSVVTPNLSPRVRPNALKIERATLVHSGNVAEVAQRVYDYHQQRYRQRMKLYAPLVEAGNVTTIDTLYGKKLRGVIEKMEIDLARGMVAACELTGVEDVG